MINKTKPWESHRSLSEPPNCVWHWALLLLAVISKNTVSVQRYSNCFAQCTIRAVIWISDSHCLGCLINARAEDVNSDLKPEMFWLPSLCLFSRWLLGQVWMLALPSSHPVDSDWSRTSGDLTAFTRGSPQCSQVSLSSQCLIISGY